MNGIRSQSVAACFRSASLFLVVVVVLGMLAAPALAQIDVSVEVGPAANPRPVAPGLPRTGADIAAWLAAGLALIGLGTALLKVRRSKERKERTLA